SELAGEPLTLVEASGQFGGSDVYPVTLLGDASVAAIADEGGGDGLDVRRFRMLIGFSGPPAYAGGGWAGRQLSIGDACVEVGGEVPRCASTTRDPDTGVRDVAVVRLIKAARGMRPTEFGFPGANLGVYATVSVPGTVRLGDRLELDERPAVRRRANRL